MLTEVGADQNPKVLNYLALSYSMQGNHKKACELFSRALELPFSDPYVRSAVIDNFATLLSLGGEWEQVQQVLASRTPASDLHPFTTNLTEFYALRAQDKAEEALLKLIWLQGVSPYDFRIFSALAGPAIRQ